MFFFRTEDEDVREKMEINAYVRETTILKCPYASSRCQRKDFFFNHVKGNQGSANSLEVNNDKKLPSRFL